MKVHGTSNNDGNKCAPQSGGQPASDNTLDEYEVPGSTGSSTAATQSGTFGHSIVTSTGTTWGWVELEVDFQASSPFGKYIVKPDVTTSATTGKPSTASVYGYAWVSNTDIRSATTGSGTWTLNITAAVNSISGRPVGNVWITVWSCGTN